MNLETKITIYKFTPQVFTLTRFYEVCQVQIQLLFLRPYKKPLVHIILH